MVTIHLMDEQGVEFGTVAHADEVTAAKAAWMLVRCEVGPLEAEPDSLESFLDAYADAFGGELDAIVDFDGE